MHTLLASVLLVAVLLTTRSTAEFIYGSILEYAQNISAVYRDPGHVFGEDLMRTAVFYLDELMELEEALEDKDEEGKALEMLSKIYHRGGPKHTTNIPYGKLIDEYKWTSEEVDDYAKYVDMTTKSWKRLLALIQNYIKEGKITPKT